MHVCMIWAFNVVLATNKHVPSEVQVKHDFSAMHALQLVAPDLIMARIVTAELAMLIN